MKEEKKYLTVAQVAQYLQVTETTVYRYMNDPVNPLHYWKMSPKAIRISLEDIEDWKNKNSNKQ